MIIRKKIKYVLCLVISTLFMFSLSAQDKKEITKKNALKKDFSDRKAIIETVENFYIGDHTGSTKYKKLSMHKKGAYRYVNRDGEYKEGVFKLDANNADPNFKEELLSVEIYDTVALVRLRHMRNKQSSYKLMLLHKAKGKWKITSISWGIGITQ